MNGGVPYLVSPDAWKVVGSKAHGPSRATPCRSFCCAGSLVVLINDTDQTTALKKQADHSFMVITGPKSHTDLLLVDAVYPLE